MVCLLALASAIAPAAQQRTVKGDEQAIIELERGWNAALYRKDLPFIENLLADEFIGTYDDGSRGDKANELALAAAFNQRVDSAIQDEFVVKIYGDTAVTWFSLHMVGPSQGRRLEITLRFVDVFVMRAGRWQCVSSQSTKVLPK